MENSPDLVLFRSLYCGWIACVSLAGLPGHLRFVQRRGPEHPLPTLLGCIALPRLGPWAMVAVGVGMVACLIAVAVGVAPALALAGAVAGALLYHAQVIDHPTVRRKVGSVIVILFLLWAAAWPAEPSGLVAWACLLGIKAVVAQMYLSSGVLKLRHSGWRWADGRTLRAWMLDYYFFHRSRGALWLAGSLPLCRVASIAVLFFELSFWLVIPFPALAWIYLPFGIAFHLGTAALMKIHYWIHTLPAYLVFVLPLLPAAWQGA